MMSNIKILIVGLALCASCTIYADTCKEQHDDLAFRQVVIGLGSGVRCDYGPGEFDFDHSYELYGNYHPMSGPWQGSEAPDVGFCRGKYDWCEFKIK